MSIRDLQRKARRELHDAMSVPALYLVEGEVPVPCTVRVHYRFDTAGDMAGTNLSYAEIQEIDPKIVFLREQVYLPARDAIVSIEPGEAWRVDNVQQPDDITIKAIVTRLTSDEAAGLPVPGVP